MERNKNIEAFRGFAILCILFYHFSMLAKGLSETGVGYIIIEACGHFAITSFFVISGYGTYLYFTNQEKCNKKVSCCGYMKKRLKSILPQYYFCLGFMLLFTPSVVYWAKDTLYIILQSLIFVQNYNPNGAVNGVTWTLAVLVQLYFIAVPMYMLVKRWGVKTWIVSFAMVVVLKKICNTYVNINELDSIWYVVTDIRMPVTTFDLFLAGMCGAKISLKLKEDNKSISNVACSIMCILMLVVFYWSFYCFCLRIPLFSSKWMSCIWRSLTGMWIAVLLICLAQATWSYDNIFGRLIQGIAKSEFGIYLWHMVFLGYVMSSKPQLFIWMHDRYPILLLAVMMILAIGIGYISTVLTQSYNYVKLFKFLDNSK